MKMKRHNFTLMEVMIAATLLAMAVVASMGIIGSARARLLRAEKRWGRQHLLSQATECYLLGGANAQLPEGLLPQGFSSRCQLYDLEDLPEDALESIREWRLGEYHIQVFDAAGNLMQELRIRKLVKEEDLE